MLHCNVDVSIICGNCCACCYEGGIDNASDAAAVMRVALIVSVHARC